MNKKWKVRTIVSIVAICITVIVSGCGTYQAQPPTDYDFYIFNGKTENADALEKVVQQYGQEHGLKIKVFSLGTTDSAETLRSEMNSAHRPAIFSVNFGGLAEWAESQTILDLNQASNPKLKALAEKIPQTMRLTSDGAQNYGIPYNIEGYGLIIDTRMIDGLFGKEHTSAFLQDFKEASYTDFAQFVQSADNYIQTGQTATIQMNNHTYTFLAQKTELTKKLTGIFAEAGAEKWTYGDHMGNMAMNAVFDSPAAVRNATEAQIDELYSPLTKVVQTLDLYSQHAAGMEGKLSRSSDYINSTTASYDVSVQLFSSGKALFIKQGNWVYPNIAKLNKDILSTLTFLPIKLPLTASDIKVPGLTVEKFNRSVPEFVPTYYAINSKVTTHEQELAQQFLVWLNTTDAGRKAVVEDFQFIPFNADQDVTFENPLNNSLIQYRLNGDILSNPFNGSPAGGSYWGQEVFGSILQEQYLNNPKAWTKQDYDKIASQSIQEWKDVLY